MLYLMTLPCIILFALFSYMPMAGLVVAFKSFQYDAGIFGSEWSKPFYQNFVFFLSSESFFLVTWNTLFLNILFIAGALVFQVSSALALNEVSGRLFKKVTQAGILLPYFVSWIVVSFFVFSFLNYDYGLVNGLLKSLGFEPVDWYTASGYWPVIMLILYIWKNVGYGCVVYLAVLTGVDKAYYEASEIDGASKLQQIRHISFPMMTPTIITLTLLAIGRIMNADFGMFYSVVGESPLLYSSVDVIDTFVFRSLRRLGDVGMASAAGFYQSVLSFILVLLSNRLSRRINEEGSIF